MAENLATWRRRILDGLADEGVDVELGERQLDYALRRALALWTKHQPQRQWVNLGEVGPVRTYIVSFDDPQLAGVVDVVFDDIDPQTRPYVMPNTYELRWGIRGPRIYFQLHVAERRQERFTGEAPAWYWEPEEQKLYIYAPTRPVKAMALLLGKMTLENLRVDHEDDFEKAAIAHAKFLLARILGKFGSIPGAQGEITTDAAELRSEAKEELREVRERLERSMRSVPPPRFVGD